MKKKVVTVFVGLLMVVIAKADKIKENEGIEIVVAVCNFSIPEVYIKGNISFSVQALFEIDENGKPVNIEIIDYKKALILKEIITCLNKWRIKGFTKNDKFCVTWIWRHAKGWQSFKIYGPNFKQSIDVEGLMPYNKR